MINVLMEFEARSTNTRYSKRNNKGLTCSQKLTLGFASVVIAACVTIVIFNWLDDN